MISSLPVKGYWKIVLSFNADVWVPLVQSLRVLLKHPLVPSGNTMRPMGRKTIEKSQNIKVPKRNKDKTWLRHLNVESSTSFLFLMIISEVMWLFVQACKLDFIFSIQCTAVICHWLDFNFLDSQRSNSS